MKTMERTHHEVQTPEVSNRRTSGGRRTGMLVLVAVLALILGAVGGWFARGSDGDPTILLAGEGELTERQAQMVDVYEEAEAAWHAGDGEAVAALFTDDGYGRFLGSTYQVGDGGLDRYVESGAWNSLDVLEPVLVKGNTVLNFHIYRGSTYTNVVEFTTEGELLMVSHTINS